MTRSSLQALGDRLRDPETRAAARDEVRAVLSAVTVAPGDEWPEMLRVAINYGADSKERTVEVVAWLAPAMDTLARVDLADRVAILVANWGRVVETADLPEGLARVLPLVLTTGNYEAVAVCASTLPEMGGFPAGVSWSDVEAIVSDTDDDDDRGDACLALANAANSPAPASLQQLLFAALPSTTAHASRQFFAASGVASSLGVDASTVELSVACVQSAESYALAAALVVLHNSVGLVAEGTALVETLPAWFLPHMHAQLSTLHDIVQFQCLGFVRFTMRHLDVMFAHWAVWERVAKAVWDNRRYYPEVWTGFSRLVGDVVANATAPQLQQVTALLATLGWPQDTDLGDSRVSLAGGIVSAGAKLGLPLDPATWTIITTPASQLSYALVSASIHAVALVVSHDPNPPAISEWLARVHEGVQAMPEGPPQTALANNLAFIAAKVAARSDCAVARRLLESASVRLG